MPDPPSADRYRALVEALAPIIWFTNAAGLAAQESPSWQVYTGQSAEEMRGQGFWSAIHPTERPHAMREWEAARDAGRRYQAEHAIRRHDGVYQTFSVCGAPVRTAEDEVLEWAFAAKDVTGRREAEAAHRKLQALLQSTTDAVIALDSAARFTYVNAEAERILQQPRHLLLGHCVWEVFPDIVGTEIEAAYYRMVENGAPTTLETYYAPTEAWIEVRAFPIQPDSDACAAETAEPLSAGGLCVHFRDITSRKAIEAERDRLLEQERAARAAAQVAAQEVRVVLDVLPVGVAIVDAQGSIIQCNLGMDQIRGEGALYLQCLDGHAVLRERWPDGRTVSTDEWALVRAWRHGEVVEGEEVEIETTTGQRKTVLNNAAPIRDASGAIIGAVLMVQDISQRRYLEREREQMIGMVSHELKTPLTAARANLWLAQRHQERRSRRSNAAELEKIKVSLGKMERLVDDLVAVSRLEAGKVTMQKAPCDLNALCEQAAADQLAATGRTVAMDLPKKPIIATVDAQRIDQVLSNLLSNALKYSAAERRVALRLRQREGCATFAVRDKGQGIPLEAIPRLFER
ncbi:MAG TPA: PAS domain S-box protein, partial [Ktedonobacterales bacterium]